MQASMLQRVVIILAFASSVATSGVQARRRLGAQLYAQGADSHDVKYIAIDNEADVLVRTDKTMHLCWSCIDAVSAVL